MTSINDSWPEWTVFRQLERDELSLRIADINKDIERCNQIIAEHKPKQIQNQNQNAWQSRSMLRAKNAPVKLTPAQERDAALVIQRKQEEEQREENRRAQAQGRKPVVLYPQLGSLQWIQEHGKRAAMEAGLAQNAARIASAAAEESNRTTLAVSIKELARLEAVVKPLTERLHKVESDISLFTLRVQENIEGCEWSSRGYTGNTPAYIRDAQTRWNSEIDSTLDTSLPLRGHTDFGKITKSWRPGHQPGSATPKPTFSWDDLYESETESEDNDEDEDHEDNESLEDEYN